MQKVFTFKPSRLGCSSVAATIKGNVVPHKGVESVKVRFDAGVFDVSYDDEKITEEEIMKVVQKNLGIAIEKVS